MIWFIALMVITFILAVGLVLGGVLGLNNKDSGKRSSKLMLARVIVCGLLLVEMLIYYFYFKA